MFKTMGSVRVSIFAIGEQSPLYVVSATAPISGLWLMASQQRITKKFFSESSLQLVTKRGGWARSVMYSIYCIFLIIESRGSQNWL
ncbi:hypothetical protein [Trichocoleus sp. FACHB-591]|uniref:hypothetical protein n=1 Tax=Trichocoleus sp. FACHB-591 TaxID=2692872 RepID=UPI001683D708|nr:hypothetical protein [Trichocoleus sp. FACHB-591]